jgi:hypothetical protein
VESEENLMMMMNYYDSSYSFENYYFVSILIRNQSNSPWMKELEVDQLTYKERLSYGNRPFQNHQKPERKEKLQNQIFRSNPTIINQN